MTEKQNTPIDQEIIYENTTPYEKSRFENTEQDGTRQTTSTDDKLFEDASEAFLDVDGPVEDETGTDPLFAYLNEKSVNEDNYTDGNIEQDEESDTAFNKMETLNQEE